MMHILFLLYKSRKNNKGQFPLMMRISHDSKRATFFTSIYLEVNVWDQTKQKAKGNSPLIKEINNVILNMTTAAWNVYNDHLKKDIPINPETIRNIIKFRKHEQSTFFIFLVPTKCLKSIAAN
ncbi:MAG: hypothetical protein JST87_00185 [Bacteroidetes bacterium]|nr:hypothetical protein [Bacteroidota bacterium]